jgi:hypothetical protein
MPYVIIEDFRAGLDRRKLPAASPQGSLQTLQNAHITRGGEIEKRLAFVAKYPLPVGETFGYAGANGTHYVFGSEDSPGVPAGVTYQQLVAPNAAAMTAIIATEFFDGKAAVIAEYADGARYVFYDGARVTDFDAGSGAVAVAGAVPNGLLTHHEKLYVIYKSILAFSAIEEPTRYQDSPPDSNTFVGFGFKNMSNQSAGSETLTAMGRYQNWLAVFARRNIQIWYLDPDPLQNAQKQVLENIGTFAPNSVVPFGDIDVFFLSDSGIRSLRARDSSNQSGVADVGTPIDEFMLEYLSTLTEAERTAAVGCMEPIDGRYILAVGNQCFVFSYYASSRTSAWSTYDLGDVEIKNFVVMDGRVWARSGNTIYLLGGDDGKTTTQSPVEVDLPYIDGRQIATFKNFTALDVVCEGEWKIFVNTDPTQPDEESEVAIINGTTLNLDMIGLIGHSPLVKLRLENTAIGPARLSKIVVHYSPAEAT